MGLFPQKVATTLYKKFHFTPKKVVAELPPILV